MLSTAVYSLALQAQASLENPSHHLQPFLTLSWIGSFQDSQLLLRAAALAFASLSLLGLCFQVGHSDKKAEQNACNNSRACVSAYPTQVRQGLVWVWADCSPQACIESTMQQPALSPEYGKYEGIGTGTNLRTPVVALPLLVVQSKWNVPILLGLRSYQDLPYASSSGNVSVNAKS